MYLPYQSFKLVILKWIDLFFKLNEEHFTFHLQYKHFGMFANRNLKNFLTPKSENMRAHCSNSIEIQPHYPIIVNQVVKMRPHPPAQPH